MAITLGSNIASLRAQRKLSETSSELSTVFERLSSGQRINRASDDAAGLAIADALKADSKIFRQGVRNLNDGLSLLNIADSAIEILSSIVIRLEELATQAANGVYGAQQRKALDAEAQALSDEFFRISKTTEFNGLNLFTGENPIISLQAGAGENAIINTSVGGAIGTGGFGTASTFSVGAFPVSVTTGDFNGDGILDLVTADQGANTISVLLGDGTGGFGTASTFSVGAGPLSVTTGDFNGDGILDLVTADFFGGNSVLLGDGTGGFGTASTFSVGFSPFSVTTGDFNGDGILDLVTADNGPDIISVLLGDGTGGFGTASTFTVGASPVSVTTGDFNGDGILDLVTADSGGTTSVLLGDGTGGFGTASTFSVGASPFSVTTGDFNGDGILDLVTADSGGGTTSVLLGNGTGGFGTASTFSVGGTPTSVTTGDFNGDGILDLVTADYGSGTTSVLLGDGTGGFGTASTFSVGANPRSVTTGDFNGDGILDLVTTDTGPDTISVLLGKTKDGVAPLLEFSLLTLADARQALPVFSRKREQLAAQRGEIGAYQARIEVAVNVLEVASENFRAAESRIRDADIAEEAAKLTRLNILQQASAAILAQANQQPALALQLLG